MSRSGKFLLKLCTGSSSSPTSPPLSPPPPQPPSPEAQQPSTEAQQPSPPPLPLPPPNAFLCPISGRLFADPVILIPSGHTFERACIQACQELNFTPPILRSFSSSSSSSSSTSSPSFFFFPNNTFKNSILQWCDYASHPHPIPVSQEEALAIVKSLKDSNQETPPAAADPDPFEEEFLMSLKKPESSEWELALRNLNLIIATNRDRVVSLCTPTILAAIIPLFDAASQQYLEHWRVPVFATAALATFSELPANGTKMLRLGAVPPLLDVLANGRQVARTNAATAINNMAADKQNRTAIGALGAIPPLLDTFLDCHFGRNVAVQALYRLTLKCPDNLAILANMEGAVSKLLVVVADKSSGDGDKASALREHALMLLCNLAGASKGREDLIGVGAVEQMVRMVRDGGRREQDKYCLSVMYKICTDCSTIFKQLARAAGADAVLSLDKEEWGEEGRDMAKKMLQVIREDQESL